MQSRIILMRHGHAEDKSDDFVRPLSPAGCAAVRRAGAALARAGWTPEFVVTSSAPRARHTAELVAETCGYSGPIEDDNSLYLATEAQYLAALQRLPEGLRSVLLVGHNPGLTALAQQLCRHPRDLAPAEYVSAPFELDDWAQLL
jgi:phosphohistidine phosphatase